MPVYLPIPRGQSARKRRIGLSEARDLLARLDLVQLRRHDLLGRSSGYRAHKVHSLSGAATGGPEMGRRARPILAHVFAVLGIALVIASGVAAADRATDLAGSIHAEGTVFALSGGAQGFAPVVQFTPISGGTVPFTAGVDSNPPAYRVGDHVGVLYPPGRPQDAVIDSFWQVWFAAALFALIGVSLIVVGIALAIVDLATRRSLRWPLPQ